MEVRGFEPLAYRLRTYRSSQLSYTPIGIPKTIPEDHLSQGEHDASLPHSLFGIGTEK